MGYCLRHFRKYDDKMQVFGERMSATEKDKRRRCTEEEEAGTRGPLHGTKRKLQEEAETEETTSGDAESGEYTEQRRSVFSVLMCKLHRYRQVADPSLRRSVLICNTLRSIEREMVNEGVELDIGTHPVPFLPPLQTDNVTLDPPPPSLTDPPTFIVMLPLEPRSGCDMPSEKGDVVELPGRAASCPSPTEAGTARSAALREHAPKSLPRLLHDSEDDLPGVISWSSVLNFSNQNDDVDVVGTQHPCDDLWPSDTGSKDQESGGPNTSPSASSDSGISTASDEIFGDIDLSLYDFDLLPLSPPNARVAPPTVEELLYSFPGEQAMVAPPCAHHPHSSMHCEQADRTAHDPSNDFHSV